MPEMKFVDVKGKPHLKIGGLLFTMKKGQRARVRNRKYMKEKKKSKKKTK